LRARAVADDPRGVVGCAGVAMVGATDGGIVCRNGQVTGY
jgi:hypothetical protein